jgi:hypothetical protein
MAKRTYALVLLVLAVPAALAKGPIVAIEITGDGISVPLRITDADLVGNFSIWNGPGVSTSTAGVKDPPAHLDTGVHDGRFIDWPRGLTAQRPTGLQRFEVTFHLATPGTASRYVVAYEIDPRNGQGYIYLPSWTNELIWHGVEGHWLYASRRWDELVMPRIVQRVSARAEKSRFRCTVGTARMSDDGTIILQLIVNGRKASQFIYPPTDNAYADVKMHIGDIAPGAEVTASCWPHRNRL